MFRYRNIDGLNKAIDEFKVSFNKNPGHIVMGMRDYARFIFDVKLYVETVKAFDESRINDFKDVLNDPKKYRNIKIVIVHPDFCQISH